MKTGTLVGGIILLIIGIAVYSYLQTTVSDCQSFLGQLGRFFSSDIAQRCQTVALIQIGSIFMGVIGLGIMIYGAVAKNDSSQYYSEMKSTNTENFTAESRHDMTEEEKNLHYLGILKERLANGEITKEQYDELKKEFE